MGSAGPAIRESVALLTLWSLEIELRALENPSFILGIGSIVVLWYCVVVLRLEPKHKKRESPRFR